jgi:hypothetical protein
VERETGIEPATNSLEGCDSTTELLPPSRAPTRPSDVVSLRFPTNFRAAAREARLPRCPELISKLPIDWVSLTNLSSISRANLFSAREARGERLVGRGGFEPP